MGDIMTTQPGFIAQHIRSKFPYELSGSQEEAVNTLDGYLSSAPEGSLFLLKGYAGTGKSSLVGQLCQSLLTIGINVVLLAPTGRAAKVLAGYCGAPAYTIHRVIYRQKVVDYTMSEFGKDKNFFRPGTVFMVDEASMIDNQSDGLSPFGSGHLLEDLLDYIFSVPDCRAIFIGDDAQLPPVGSPLSPALDTNYLKAYCSEIYTATLTDIVRQEEDSDIVRLGSILRDHIIQLNQNPEIQYQEDFKPLSPIPFEPNGSDVTFLSGEFLPDHIETSIAECGMDEFVIVTRSNRDAEAFNLQMRQRQFGYDEPLVRGERVLVCRNNYYYYPGAEEERKKAKASKFTANGEILTVESVEGSQRLYGKSFRDVLLQTENGELFDAKVILDTLANGASSMSANERLNFFEEVCLDYPDIHNKRTLYTTLRQHPFLNALQIKYAYAMTCHKSQGGQWKDVYVYIGYVTREMMDLDFYRWLYTAVTRATRHLYIINPPKHIFPSDDTW